jgi:dephospho-CoA kinase
MADQGAALQRKGPTRPYVIGLTGNIASGKSLVGEILAQLGAEHLDADRLAHQVMAPNTTAWHEIVAAFGARIVGPEGKLDRQALGRVVFGDAAALARLEAIVHPRVIALTRQRIADSRAPVIVVEAIKLIESGMVRQFCNAVWVVIAPREVRLSRLIEQRGLSRTAAELRVDAQPPQEEKIAHADVVIDNGGTVEQTVRQIKRAWAEIGSEEK